MLFKSTWPTKKLMCTHTDLQSSHTLAVERKLFYCCYYYYYCLFQIIFVGVNEMLMKISMNFIIIAHS